MMKLAFLPLDKLSVSKSNMRDGKKPPVLIDILPSIRARGILVPVLVRPNGSPETYEIVAGRRRYHAALTLAAESGEAEPMPCAILEDTDDVAALEASLIENIARHNPHEVTQWATFTNLVKAGRSMEDIELTFGLPALQVRRILALGHLLPRIRELYRTEAIDRLTVRQLTLASKSQQKSWLALHDDPETYCPVGHQLKTWLFGGAAVSCAHALFDLATYQGQIVSDLFGEDSYFADADMFWTAQHAAIAARAAAYLDAGWADVVTLPVGEYFSAWEYEKSPKRKGGRVYVSISHRGEVTFHEGYVTCKEALRGPKTEGQTQKPVRPEMSGPLQTYVDLHRHAAVRASLTFHPHLALRLMVAHAIAGSTLWNVRIEAQSARNDAIQESVENARAEAGFDERRRAVLDLLHADPDAPTVTGCDENGVTGIFLRLIDLPDTAVLDVLAIVMGETLARGSAEVEVVGAEIGVGMAAWWQVDEAFFGLLRDREVVLAMVGDVAGADIARANGTEKTKTLKAILSDHVCGSNGRARVENWVPRWMQFPPSAYTTRGGVGTIDRHDWVETVRFPTVPETVIEENLALPAVPDRQAA
jgi:ParB family chromosome partitioning protein